MIIDPDQEVQAAIADVFRAFAQTGSAYGVVGVFAGRRFPKRARGGAWAGELRWGPLTLSRVAADPSQPVLRRGVCVRALPLPPGRRSRTARSRPRRSSCRARSGRC